MSHQELTRGHPRRARPHEGCLHVRRGRDPHHVRHTFCQVCNRGYSDIDITMAVGRGRAHDYVINYWKNVLVS
jgi:hypothetical protein